MILEIENWYLGYQKIQHDCGDTGSVLILCRPTADALAAARILSYMLRADHIAYHLQACTNTLAEDLQKTTATCIVLIHLGATVNLTPWFTGPKIFILDPARPVHLANIHSGDDILVFWDLDETEIPSDGENLSGNDSSSSSSAGDDEEDEESSEEEAEEENEEGEFEFQDDNDENKGVNADVERNEDGNEDDSVSISRPKKMRIEEEPTQAATEPTQDTAQEDQDMSQARPSLMTPREWQQNRRQRIQKYYSAGNYYGAPSSFVTYQLASQLRFGQEKTLLWLACVGVTDAFWHGRLDFTGYSTLALQLREACQKLDDHSGDANDNMLQRASHTVYAEQLDGSIGSERTKLSLRGTGRVFAQADFKFFLLRFTSLLEAMLYSETVSTQLQLYTPKGMQKLKELLAKMGFPLSECQQPYPFMKPSLRRCLADKLDEYAGDYGLEQFQYTSFFRITGYQSVLSATDTAHAVAALLDFGEDNEEGGVFNRALDALQSNAPPKVVDLQNEDTLVNGGNLTGNPLGYGLYLAMKLQKLIFATAASLVERNAITSLYHFRYAYVGDDSVLAKPAVLTRLAQYLFQLHRISGKWVGHPLVLLANDGDFYTVAGYEYTERAGDWVRNRWGQHFSLAAQSMTGTFSFGHDSHVVRVAADDVQRFLEQLHYLMDAQ